jgi:regulator of protease activity HflC (stomatin/prohibitin superfamily)
VDIHSNIILLSNEVVREVLSKHTITEIAGEQREIVVTEIKGKLSDVLANILRIEVAGVQINSLDFSPQYKDAINQATLARTKTFAAQQDAERAKVEAQTRVIQAQAEADAQAARADGQGRAQLIQAQAEANGNLARARADAEGNLLKAKADAEALRLRGDAAASRARIEAAGSADNYIRQIDAQSKLRWNGQVPQFMLGGGGANAPTMPIILPMQGPAPAAQSTPAPAQAARGGEGGLRRFVGWVERQRNPPSTAPRGNALDGFRCALPILRSGSFTARTHTEELQVASSPDERSDIRVQRRSR